MKASWKAVVAPAYFPVTVRAHPAYKIGDMKMLLALFLALFALTTAVPAAAARTPCNMAGSEMQGMAMGRDQQEQTGSCCDHDKLCAQACEVLCAPNVVTPNRYVPKVASQMRMDALARSAPLLASFDLPSIDPPPKIAG